MTLNNIPVSTIHRLQTRRLFQRLGHHPGATTSPSEQAIRSIDEFRSTPRW